MCYLRFTPKGLQYLTLDEALDIVEKDNVPENRLAILFGYDVIVPVCPFVDTWECGEWEETLIVHFGTVSTPF